MSLACCQREVRATHAPLVRSECPTQGKAPSSLRTTDLHEWHVELNNLPGQHSDHTYDSAQSLWVLLCNQLFLLSHITNLTQSCSFLVYISWIQPSLVIKSNQIQYQIKLNYPGQIHNHTPYHELWNAFYNQSSDVQQNLHKNRICLHINRKKENTKWHIDIKDTNDRWKNVWPVCGLKCRYVQLYLQYNAVQHELRLLQWKNPNIIFMITEHAMFIARNVGCVGVLQRSPRYVFIRVCKYS